MMPTGATGNPGHGHEGPEKTHVPGGDGRRSPVGRILVLLGVVALLTLSAGGAGAGEKPLLLLNWAEYFDPQVLAEFTQATGIPIKEVHFETDEMRDEYLLQTAGPSYDLALMDAERALTYRQSGKLAPIPWERLPNVRHIAPRWREATGDARDHTVPLFWGTVGIVYRQDKVPDKVTRWEQLFHPPEAWRQRIALIKDSGDLLGMALKSMGRSLNPMDPKELDGVEALLLAQKPFVRDYGYLELDASSDLVTGKTWLAMAYNGDALALQKLDPRITFVIPEEGTMLWLDTLAVLASSSRKEAAYAFLDFVHRPEMAARMAQFAHYATVNEAAARLLPPEFVGNPVIYPPAEVLARSEYSVTLPPRVMKRMKAIFTRVTQ